LNRHRRDDALALALVYVTASEIRTRDLAIANPALPHGRELKRMFNTWLWR